jgi:hypothetical protein
VYSGVEAAETGESDARERGRECCARDGTVGVAQYVIFTLQSTEGRVNARETGAGCNDWISWSNNYSVWPVIGRGETDLGEKSRELASFPAAISRRNCYRSSSTLALGSLPR